MRIALRQFLGKNHSWAVIGQEFARTCIQRKHQVQLYSTDGIQHLPNDLKPFLIGYRDNITGQTFGQLPEKDFDACFSYSCMKNWPHHLSHSSHNRLGHWCFEWAGRNILPLGFAKFHNHCDHLITPSDFAKQIFVDSRVPSNKIVVIPHGINLQSFQNTSTIPLPTTKQFKILANIAQNHKRKNIPGLLTAYGKAFTIKDDVCLLLKGKEKPITQQFEVSLNKCLQDFNQAFPQHAEIKVMPDFLEDMAPLYRSIDAVFTMSHTECFYIPGLEALASGKLNICPRYGGQLDFLNDDNALLIDTQIGRADPTSMYWESKPNASWGIPSIDDAIDKLRYAYDNHQRLNAELETKRSDVFTRFGWDTIADQILALCK
jgi:glycosyltransferase involved in cell wall biosynthesis